MATTFAPKDPALSQQAVADASTFPSPAGMNLASGEPAPIVVKP